MWYLGIFATMSRTASATDASRLYCWRQCSALGQVAVDPQATLPTIGASGAIAGVRAHNSVLYPRSRVLT